MRFIYTFDTATRDTLMEQGYELIYSNSSASFPLWVLDNPSGVDPGIEGIPYALSDTMTFEGMVTESSTDAEPLVREVER